MIPFLPILAVVGTLLLAAGVVGAFWVNIRGSATKESRDTWREESEAQKAKADRLQEQVEELVDQVQKLTARIVLLESEKSRLEKMVTAQAEIQELSRKVDLHHSDLMAAILTVNAGVNAAHPS